MIRSLSVLALLAALGSPAAVLAQQADSDSESQPQAVQDDDIPNPMALAMGEPEQDPNAPGTPYLREVNGDWGLECIRMEEGVEEPCQMFQALTDDNGNLVSNVRIFRLPEGGQAVAGALIAVPLETMLTAQLTITVDGGQPKRYPFVVCDSMGCYARIGLTAEDVTAFRRGANAKVGLVPFVAPDERLLLNMSLTGFTATYDASTIMPE